MLGPPWTPYLTFWQVISSSGLRFHVCKTEWPGGLTPKPTLEIKSTLLQPSGQAGFSFPRISGMSNSWKPSGRWKQVGGHPQPQKLTCITCLMNFCFIACCFRDPWAWEHLLPAVPQSAPTTCLSRRSGQRCGCRSEQSHMPGFWASRSTPLCSIVRPGVSEGAHWPRNSRGASSSPNAFCSLPMAWEGGRRVAVLPPSRSGLLCSWVQLVPAPAIVLASLTCLFCIRI